jgi:hypothetical protein
MKQLGDPKYGDFQRREGDDPMPSKEVQGFGAEDQPRTI